MKLQRLSIVVAALTIAASVDLLSDTKSATAVTLTGLTDNNTLLLFDSATPSDATSVQVTGVTGQLLGIDLRPANNLIYGLTDTNNIYTINPFSGAATFVSTLSTPFSGDSFSGVDFNPVVDRLRVVGSNDQNFRVNVDTGATLVDGALNPGNPFITAAAYTNADNDPATPTVLYTIDFLSEQLSIQNPPNAGTQVSVGSLGVTINDPRVGFDIVTAGGVNTAFAGIFDFIDASLYTVDLGSGAATRVGKIGDGTRAILGLTAAPAPAKAVPEPATMAGLAIVGAGLAASRRRLKKASS